MTSTDAYHSVALSNQPLSASIIDSSYNSKVTLAATGALHSGVVDGRDKEDPEDPKNWTIEGVAGWLKAKGFEQHICDKFIEQEVTGDVLLKLDANRIKSEFPDFTLEKQTQLATAISEITVRTYNVKLPQNRMCNANYTLTKARSLVVCIDGTLDQFGNKPTNVVELYKNLVKSSQQITYYNSGIGTFPMPQKWSFSHWKQVLYHKIDLAISWNFEKPVLDAYQWLSENYQNGDYIYLFGFSRGAYQVRTLAGMIAKVGLIYKDNEEQISFAYKLYTSIPQVSGDYSRAHALATTTVTSKTSSITLNRFDGNYTHWAKHFKDTFCHQDVHIHFVGVWDTISSIGITSLPKTLPPKQYTCYFRHALAADEQRVNFLPEYANGGTFKISPSLEEPEADALFNHGNEQLLPRIKEVWFRGTHSDIGGENAENLNMICKHPAYLWITYEAFQAGLQLSKSLEVEQDLKQFGQTSESLTGYQKILEYLPVKQLSYTTPTHKTFWPHFGHGRKIVEGQKVHISFAFLDGTAPSAMLYDSRDLSKLAGAGLQPSAGWMEDWRDLLETSFPGDLFGAPKLEGNTFNPEPLSLSGLDDPSNSLIQNDSMCLTVD